VWDVGFLGAEPQRAHAIDFTAAYVEIEAIYLVPPGSPLQAIAEVDRPGVRIAAPDRSAYELYLTRSLQHAQLVRVSGADNAFQRFVADQLDALAGLRPRLVTDQDNLPGSRLLEGNFTAVQQAAGTPKGRPAGARYLCLHRGHQDYGAGGADDRKTPRARPHRGPAGLMGLCRNAHLRPCAVCAPCMIQRDEREYSWRSAAQVPTFPRRVF
jgi:hypothetical protein